MASGKAVFSGGSVVSSDWREPDKNACLAGQPRDILQVTLT